MTVASFVMPLLGRKADVVYTAGIATTEFVGVAVPAGSIGLLIDEADIVLAQIESGQVSVPALTLANSIIDNSRTYTTLATGTALAIGCVNGSPKTSVSMLNIPDPAVLALSGLFTDGKNMSLVINDPSPKTTGIAFAAAGYLNDFMRELVS
jgi:hypothetical protein